MNYSLKYKEENLRVSDGTNLYTRTIFPENYTEGKRCPVVFHRTPYEPSTARSPFDLSYLKAPFTDFLQRGYIVVNQHCRGTGSSEGVFRNMMKYERTDSLETLDWIRSQPWYDGEIYLYGVSYKSYIHSTYIGTNPEGVRGAALAVMPANQFYICYEKNTAKHDLFTLWFARFFKRNNLDTKEKFALMREELCKRPLSDIGERVYGEKIPEIEGVFRNNHPSDNFWHSQEGFSYSTDAPENISVPLLLIGGFYDIHYAGTLDYWSRLNKKAKKKSAMYIGPWWHSLETPEEHRQFFPGSEHPPIEAEWFDHIRLGTPLTHVTESKVTYYRAGDGWLQCDYIGANANLVFDLYPAYNSHLCSKPSSGFLSYDYDPCNPAYFPGGANVFQSGNGGMQIQPQINFRPDVLSFVSAPFEKSMTLDGKIHIALEVSTDCDDSAFFVRADIVRDGQAWCQRDTIVSISDFTDKYVHGQKIILEFNIDPIAWKLQKGDCIRIDISSSDFPTYNAHSNTSDYWCDATETKIAHNTVYFDNTVFEFEISK